MTAARVIPCLLLRNGLLVRSERFSTHQVIGNPITTVRRLGDWNADELVLLDIGADDEHDLRRDDLQVRGIGSRFVEIVESVSRVCFMPLAVGGRIRTLEDIAVRLAAGADKCVINTRAVEDPSFVERAARRFGAQCIVASIDVRREEGGRAEVWTRRGTQPTGLDPASWAAEVERAGAGEILLNSIDRDGTAAGFDLDLVRSVVAATTIPVIACGGAGRYADFPAALRDGGASAVAASNIFHFFELAYPRARQACLDAGLPVRPVRLRHRWARREPAYDRAVEDGVLEDRRAGRRPRAAGPAPARRPMRWCARCVYPVLSATPMALDAQGVCMGCRMAEAKRAIPPAEWRRRRRRLREILEAGRARSSGDYDCIIPVSGGKDSYYQTHVIRNELGLRPLLVTYDANNWTDVGWRNVRRMKEAFDVDHVFCAPSVSVLRSLNRLGFVAMGDMNWHSHVGITTAPVRVAVETRTPLVVWGEHGYTDLSGQFSMRDFPEMTYRQRLEHFGRDYEWTWFVGRDGLTEQQLALWRYPPDEQLWTLDVQGIYLGMYLYWEANDHARLVAEEYGFETADEPLDRTYRTMSTLDDMHDSGAHDYLKYVKFGYGRCTDHASKDVRAGLMTRERAVELVRAYDHVRPRDLDRWLEYVGMTEDEFDRVADTFRDPRVWRREDGAWAKDHVWDAAAAPDAGPLVSA